jgi:hypothetical protein
MLPPSCAWPRPFWVTWVGRADGWLPLFPRHEMMSAASRRTSGRWMNALCWEFDRGFLDGDYLICGFVALSVVMRGPGFP